MRYFSTFTGIGGFELGIELAHDVLRNADRGANRGSKTHTAGTKGQGLFTPQRKGADTARGRASASTANSTDERPLCVGFSEIDKHATQIYQQHFPNHLNYGDITKIDAEALPDFDLLVGGFPCQAFSIAGKRKGFEDTRGTLFFDLARILRAKQPRLFTFENVKGLLSHADGSTFRTIIATLDELGYDCQWQVLNSKNHGVPQNRERVYIVGHLRGTPRPEVFPICGTDSTPIEIERLNNPHHSTDRVYSPDGVSPTLSTMQGGGRQPYVMQVGTRKDSNSGTQPFQQDRVYATEGISPALQQALPDGGHKIRIPEATKKGYAEAVPGQAINLAVPNSKTRRGRVSDVAQTLDTSMQQHTLMPRGGGAASYPYRVRALAGLS